MKNLSKNIIFIKYNMNKSFDKIDISREGITGIKIIHFLRVIFNSEATKALNSYSTFHDIEFHRLWWSWKRGIILDVDECVAPHHGNILPQNLEMIKQLIWDGWKIVIFSNMKKSDRYEELESLWIKVITSKFAKPDPRGFLEAVFELWLTPEKILMVGDNFLTDGGSIQAWIDFIKIHPIETGDSSRKLWRSIQIQVRSLVDRIAKIRWNIN